MKQVLFVDDEEGSVMPYFQKLQDNGIAMDLARNGDEAIDYLQRKMYDLIVLDIMLPPGNMMGKDIEPRKTGSTLLKKIRQSEISNMKITPAVAVVVLTAVTDQELLESIRLLGVDEIFQKPASFEKVTKKLIELLMAETGR